MNVSLLIMEWVVLFLGLAMLVLDLWTPAAQKRLLGWVILLVLGFVLAGSFLFVIDRPVYAFGHMYVLDSLALFFKRLFVIVAMMVIALAMESEQRLAQGVVEYYALTLFGLAGMMFAASANDFAFLFVALELITVTFYVLVAMNRPLFASLEAGVKYLILGALASGFLVFGIALIYGGSGVLSFDGLIELGLELKDNALVQVGLGLVLVGLGFKIAMVPFHVWVPDVYQGAPTPTTAFLAAGSKAAGVVLLLRVLYLALPQVARQWQTLWMVAAVVTLLFGSLAAIPQRNLKRLLGYSSIANAGFVLLGICVFSESGVSAMLFFLTSYALAVLVALGVAGLILRDLEYEDLHDLADLHTRSPFLAAALAASMVSLAGIPPMAGFFGKFLLFKALVERAESDPRFYWMLGFAVFGAIVSVYYYFGVIKAIYWGRAVRVEREPIRVSLLMWLALCAALGGVVMFGIKPGILMSWAGEAVKMLKF